MTLLDRILSVFGVSKIIKIEGISDFDQLKPHHIPAMINAFLDGGNDQFDEIALSEFLNWKLTDSRLLKIRDELKKNAFTAASGEGWSEPNIPYLESVKDRLAGDAR